MVGPGKGESRPELWLPPQGRARIRDFGTRLGWEDMFETTFDVHDYEEDVPFLTAAGLEVLALRLPHYTLRTYGLRVSNGSHTLAYSGDSGPDDRLTEVARDADLFVCEATLLRGELDGSPRGHLSVEEAVEAFEASSAKRLLLTHRPDELPRPDGYELAYDGLVIELGP
jgi:ribonuclease BN (tRNA processing enzyme)